ncbi:hypothetical protein [Streptomonospora nanhaiensis]|uniref:hypothetical protein n=1 Tax=Streptomonospora nanhaiensis TaxID=1323731 RepID=UPI001C394AAD|nr:hypothetical protein [Streptomonospora nanhaiensis]MBV2364670.1 hypothetical protein [Streptomonospora nanhaiensis]
MAKFLHLAFVEWKVGHRVGGGDFGDHPAVPLRRLRRRSVELLAEDRERQQADRRLGLRSQPFDDGSQALLEPAG